MNDFFLYYKALHLIFMVSWFAGLFYTVRLFIYFSEADDTFKENASILKVQYQLMQRRLWYIIAWPAMLLTLTFGILMLVSNPAFLSIPYMHVKLTLVFLLVIYHVLCHFIFLQQKKNINNFNLNKLKSDLLNSFKDHVNKTNEVRNPGKIPNSLITNPAIQAP